MFIEINHIIQNKRIQKKYLVVLRHVNNDGVRGVREHLRAVSVTPVQHVPLQQSGFKYLSSNMYYVTSTY